ncbi:cytidine deaminase [Myroides sp. LJL115]
MKKIEVISSFLQYDSLGELPMDIQMLMQKAIEVRKNAYAPYSKFRVGTALLLDDGSIVVGSNQENSAYPSGLCAERTAIFYANAVHPEKKIIRMAITASSDLKLTTVPIPPCGACRQSILEYEVKQDLPIEMYFMGAEGAVYYSESLTNILPFPFDKDAL